MKKDEQPAHIAFRPGVPSEQQLVAFLPDDTIQIGGPFTRDLFPIKIYVSGKLLVPVNGCTCATCELLRLVPDPKASAGQ